MWLINQKIGVSGIGFSGGEPVLHRVLFRLLTMHVKRVKRNTGYKCGDLNDRQIEEIVNVIQTIRSP